MKFFYIISLFFFLSCQSKNKENKHLNFENDSLKHVIEVLKLQLEEKDSLQNNEQVTVANTGIRRLTSKFNNQEYLLKISYPKNYYRDKNKEYPVLYVIDAETNFGGVSYIVQRLIKDKLMPPTIVIGIAYDTNYRNFYKLRSRDLTPVEDKDLKMGNHNVDPTGGAPHFMNFFEFELFPFIDKEFRVQKGERAIYGHSYGGLFGSTVLLERPYLFNKYLLLGSSLWFDDKLIVKEAEGKNLTIKNKTKLYMASGEFDLRIKEYQEEYVQLLRNKNIQSLNIKSAVVKNETHRTIFGVGFTNGLRYLYDSY